MLLRPLPTDNRPALLDRTGPGQGTNRGAGYGHTHTHMQVLEVLTHALDTRAHAPQTVLVLLVHPTFPTSPRPTRGVHHAPDDDDGGPAGMTSPGTRLLGDCDARRMGAGEGGLSTRGTTGPPPAPPLAAPPPVEPPPAAAAGDPRARPVPSEDTVARDATPPEPTMTRGGGTPLLPRPVGVPTRGRTSVDPGMAWEMGPEAYDWRGGGGATVAQPNQHTHTQQQQQQQQLSAV